MSETTSTQGPPEAIDLLIHSASQLVTCAGDENPRRGAAMRQLNIIDNGAVAVHRERIVAVGHTYDLRARYEAHKAIDATGRAVVPGFVDSHTHAVYGGDRAQEFEMRIRGATYVEIMATGGGILSTMQHTRQASEEALLVTARQRLDQMLAQGSTTVEIKTGYGLDVQSELKMLRVIEALDRTHACDVVPTFLGAHTAPPEYKDDAEGYTRLVIEEMLPQAVEWYQASHFADTGVPFFADVFCEEHAFDVSQSRRILHAALDAGLRAKIHVDQFNSLGGLEMALDLGVTSADHLEASTPSSLQRLAQSDAIAVPLPAVSFNLADDKYADARALLDAGAALALATDLNPGSAPCYGMPLVMAIACRYQRLLPAEALITSTINAAHALSLGMRIGSLEPGKQADLLILRDHDYRHCAYFFGGNPVHTVIKRGQVV
ncbi:MAG TPA: imidazolonepropionase [Candidatus Sulfomarinibacteraceae bacterium]|nr:imidazolonepropionase [Candidatus Sulfomarinibacteraceae bacterium]